MHHLAFSFSIKWLTVYHALLAAKDQKTPLGLNIQSIDLFSDIFDHILFFKSYLKLTLIPRHLIHIHLFRINPLSRKLT
jgi:hypothetical protein